MSKVAVTFGRGNPPTAGHKKLADKVKEIADKEGASYELHWSHSQDKKKNPLDHKTKVSFMKKLMPSHRAAIKSEDSVRDPISLMKYLESKGHKEVHVVVGSDRVEGMKKLLNAYNGKEYNFDRIHVHSAGTRDPDAEGVAGMSASKMREHALNDDHDSFHKGLPEGTPLKTSKQLFNAVKKGLKMNESVLQEGIKPRFERPTGTEEHDEVKTQLGGSGYFPDHVYDQLNKLADPKKYAEALQGAKIRAVAPHEWRQVGNTDAGGVTRDAKSRYKTLSSINPEKLKRVKDLYNGTDKIKMPIILHDEATGHHHLIAGNTRATVGANGGNAVHALFIHYNSSKTGQKMNNESKIEEANLSNAWYVWSREKRDKLRKQGIDDTQKLAIKIKQSQEKNKEKSEEMEEGLRSGGDNHVIMSTDPNNFGATVTGDFNNIPTKKVPTKSLVPFEPADKMKQPSSAAELSKLTKHLKNGGTLPPILVRKHPTMSGKWQIVDGHHRYFAHRQAGIDNINVKVVPDKDITTTSGNQENSNESYVDVVIKNAEELVERMSIQTLPIFFTEEEMFGDAVEILDEALSRQERIRRGMNLRKRRAMIQQKRKLKMRRMPSQEEAKRRARKMAIKILKQKFSGGKKMHELSVADKMRLEKLLTVRKGAVERIATRLVKKVRDLARSRISSSSAVGKANHPTGVGPVTVKTNKQMVKVREGEEQFDERTLTKSEEKKKEKYVKGMKKDIKGFKDRYGDRAESVMYAKATDMAKNESEQLDEYDRIEAYMHRMEQGGKTNAQHYNALAVSTNRQQQRKKNLEQLKAKKKKKKRAMMLRNRSVIKEDGMDSNSSGNDATDNRTTSFADKPTALPRNPNEPSGKGKPKKKAEQEVKLASGDVLEINPIVS